jgi:hypothetical protein
MGLDRISWILPEKGFKALRIDPGTTLSTRDRADYEERFFPGGHGLGEGGVGGFVGDVFFAGEEAEEGAALFCGVVANGSLQHGVLGFEGVKDGALRDGSLHFQ